MIGNAELDTLLDTATKAVAAMRTATAGKQSEDHAKTDVSTLLALTTLLDKLTREVGERRRVGAEVTASLSRIANLNVRGATELIEQGQWKRLCAELQAIAVQTLAAGSATGAARR